jgi:hypothetical protein
MVRVIDADRALGPLIDMSLAVFSSIDSVDVLYSRADASWICSGGPIKGNLGSVFDISTFSRLCIPAPSCSISHEMIIALRERLLDPASSGGSVRLPFPESYLEECADIGWERRFEDSRLVKNEITESTVNDLASENSCVRDSIFFLRCCTSRGSVGSTHRRPFHLQSQFIFNAVLTLRRNET